MTAEVAVDRVFALLDRRIQRTRPLTGFWLRLHLVFWFLVFLLPAFALACWIVWHVIAESLEKPDGC